MAAMGTPTYRDLPPDVPTGQLRLCSECGALIAWALRDEHTALHQRIDSLTDEVMAALVEKLAAESPKVVPITQAAGA